MLCVYYAKYKLLHLLSPAASNIKEEAVNYLNTKPGWWSRRLQENQLAYSSSALSSKATELEANRVLWYLTSRVPFVKHLVRSCGVEIAFFWKHLGWEDEETVQTGEETEMIGLVNLLFVKILLFMWLRKGISGGVPPSGVVGSKPVCFFSLPGICSRLEDVLWYLFDGTHLLGRWKATAPEDDPLQGHSELLKTLAASPQSLEHILTPPVAHIQGRCVVDLLEADG